eukprot:scaffold1190_cov187-Ochromonas_danica.AAC.24
MVMMDKKKEEEGEGSSSDGSDRHGSRPLPYSIHSNHFHPSGEPLVAHKNHGILRILSLIQRLFQIETVIASFRTTTIEAPMTCLTQPEDLSTSVNQVQLHYLLHRSDFTVYYDTLEEAREDKVKTALSKLFLPSTTTTASSQYKTTVRFLVGLTIFCGGVRVGGLCLLDSQPRDQTIFTDREKSLLIEFAMIISTILEERRRDEIRESLSLAKLVLTGNYRLQEPLHSLSQDKEDLYQAWLSYSSFDKESRQKKELIEMIEKFWKKIAIVKELVDLSLLSMRPFLPHGLHHYLLDPFQFHSRNSFLMNTFSPMKQFMKESLIYAQIEKVMLNYPHLTVNYEKYDQKKCIKEKEEELEDGYYLSSSSLEMNMDLPGLILAIETFLAYHDHVECRSSSASLSSSLEKSKGEYEVRSSSKITMRVQQEIWSQSVVGGGVWKGRLEVIFVIPRVKSSSEQGADNIIHETDVHGSDIVVLPSTTLPSSRRGHDRYEMVLKDCVYSLCHAILQDECGGMKELSYDNHDNVMVVVFWLPCDFRHAASLTDTLEPLPMICNAVTKDDYHDNCIDHQRGLFHSTSICNVETDDLFEKGEKDIPCREVLSTRRMLTFRPSYGNEKTMKRHDDFMMHQELSPSTMGGETRLGIGLGLGGIVTNSTRGHGDTVNGVNHSSRAHSVMSDTGNGGGGTNHSSGGCVDGRGASTNAGVGDGEVRSAKIIYVISSSNNKKKGKLARGFQWLLRMVGSFHGINCCHNIQAIASVRPAPLSA